MLPARRLAPDGFKAWAQVIERGYEGLVGKDEASPYREGRSLSWLKVKVPKKELDATPITFKERRERLEWQIKRVQKRMAEVETRLAGG